MSGPKSILLDPAHVQPARLKREREKARVIKASQWWKSKLSKGICEICQQKFKSSQLTMDHVLPLARGGESVKSNLQVACLKCNQAKGLGTPVDELFLKLEQDRKGTEGDFDES